MSGGRRAHGVANHVDDLFDLSGMIAFGHDADHGFGAGGADDEPPAPGQRRLALGDRRLLPEGPGERVEVRRLLDWFNIKFHEEITGPLVLEKVMKRFMSRDEGGGPPEMSAIRAARANVRYHLRYISWLLAKRNWLAGAQMSYADLAAAAHLSCVDYLGDVPWEEDEAARAWYARIKSRPSFRPLLSDRMPGMAPSAHYDNLDF